jgi:nucleotide-binding universal stress UspA family protein
MAELIERSAQELLEADAARVEGEGAGSRGAPPDGLADRRSARRRRGSRGRLVILGSTGATSVERVLLGSEAEKVLHYAKTPVLLVRDP